jgi:hypothetical protein
VTVLIGLETAALLVLALLVAGLLRSHATVLRRLLPVSGLAQPVGSVDLISPVAGGMATVTGWAFDPTHGSASTRVDSYVGTALKSTLASKQRPDVAAVYALSSAAHGFKVKIAVPAGVSQLCVYAVALDPTKHSLLKCAAVTG